MLRLKMRRAQEKQARREFRAYFNSGHLSYKASACDPFLSSQASQAHLRNPAGQEPLMHLTQILKWETFFNPSFKKKMYPKPQMTTSTPSPGHGETSESNVLFTGVLAHSLTAAYRECDACYRWGHKPRLGESTGQRQAGMNSII